MAQTFLFRSVSTAYAGPAVGYDSGGSRVQVAVQTSGFSRAQVRAVQTAGTGTTWRMRVRRGVPGLIGLPVDYATPVEITPTAPAHDILSLDAPVLVVSVTTTEENQEFDLYVTLRGEE